MSNCSILIIVLLMVLLFLLFYDTFMILFVLSCKHFVNLVLEKCYTDKLLLFALKEM